MGGASRDDLIARLGHRFDNPERLELALTHGSAVGERPGGGASNERLEFLGDRVLGLVVADMLYYRFPDEPEGALARRFAVLVQRETLARVAVEIGLPAQIELAQGEVETGGRENPSVLADACEAVIAALYLDGGFDVAAAFVRAVWASLIEEDRKPPKDAKTALQEWAQGRGRPLPSYREVERTGPAHAPLFVVEALVDGEAPETACGTSKRAAERAAAERLLERLKGKA